jgi:hypothetical protein
MNHRDKLRMARIRPLLQNFYPSFHIYFKKAETSLSYRNHFHVWEENTVYASLIAFGSQSVCSDIYTRRGKDRLGGGWEDGRARLFKRGSSSKSIKR